MADPFRQLEALGDTADGLYVVDDRQRIVRWNDGARRLLGHSADEVLYHPCYAVIAGCDRDHRPICGPDCPVQRCIARGQLPGSLEVHARTKDHGRRCLLMTVIITPVAARRLKIHVLRDVSDWTAAARFRSEVARLCEAHTSAPPDGDGNGTPANTRADRESLRRHFTKRERTVLQLLADGLSTQAISSHMGVSTFTVRNHVQHVLEKAGAHSRSEAVSLLLRGRLP